jgi:hypothetical protein
MQTLTYIIAFIALAVLARAFLLWNQNDEPIVRADDASIIVSEVNYPDNHLDSSAMYQNDLRLYPEQMNSPSTTETPPLIINEVMLPQNNTDWSLMIDNWPLPPSINLDIPFFPQAPDGNRNLPWAEACEEASIVLANYFIKNKPLTRDQFRADLLALVDRQMALFGDYIHTTVEQTKQLYLNFYGGDSYILDNPTIHDMQAILAQWYVIVAPFAGRKLGNPHYSGQWPRYHMMIIKGYDDTHFYTNDVWTRRWENFRYTHAVIMEALHDLNYDNINKGAKRILVVTQ